jgi:hypothetical protein
LKKQLIVDEVFAQSRSNYPPRRANGALEKRPTRMCTMYPKFQMSESFNDETGAGPKPTFAAWRMNSLTADKVSFRRNCSKGCFNIQGTRSLTRFNLAGFQVRSNAANAGDNRR